jgi:hypothetical protein
MTKNATYTNLLTDSSDIQGELTRLDLTLITEGTFILALILVKYATSVVKSLRNKSE